VLCVALCRWNPMHQLVLPSRRCRLLVGSLAPPLLAHRLHHLAARVQKAAPLGIPAKKQAICVDARRQQPVQQRDESVMPPATLTRFVTQMHLEGSNELGREKDLARRHCTALHPRLLCSGARRGGIAPRYALSTSSES
jgi:hypothetical protein